MTSQWTKEEELRLVNYYKANPCLWNKNHINHSKKAIREELLQQLALELSRFTVDQIKSKFHSLRSAWMREIKNPKSQWKLLKDLDFLNEVAEEEDASWKDEEVSLLIDFYRDHPDLWDHTRPKYHDKVTKDTTIAVLESQLPGKTKEQIPKKFVSLRNSYIREKKRVDGSKTTGSSTDQIYISKWKFYQDLDFLKEEVTGDESVDSFDLLKEEGKAKKMKRKSSEEDEIKVKLWKSALDILQTPEPPNEPVDPDEQWLLSLAPQLKGLSAYLKSMAKLRIQMVLHELSFSGNQEVRPTSQMSASPSFMNEMGFNYSL